METKTTDLRGDQAMRAIFCIDAANFGKLKATPDIYSFKSKPRALLVEPVNGSPFVLVDETAEPTPGTISLPRVSRVEFVPKQGSGTDKLRARMQAELFLESMVEPSAAPSP